MKILGKTASDYLILASPRDDVARGDYLGVCEEGSERRLIVQVYDETYLETPGTTEEIVRGEVLSFMGVDDDPVDLESMVSLLKDLRVLKCRARGCLGDGGFVAGLDWLPSRVSSEVKRMRLSDLLPSTRSQRCFTVGLSREGEEVQMAGEAFDASINIITGRKGSGKSHLAKVLLSKLVSLGGIIVVFDVNGEYLGIIQRKDGEPSELFNKTIIVRPGRIHRFSMDYLGRQVLAAVLQHALDTPSITVREFLRIYDALESKGEVSIRQFQDAILGWRCNEHVREALLSRLYSLIGSRLVSDRHEECIVLEEEVAKLSKGGVLIISLQGCSSLLRRLVVEVMLSKLTQLLEAEVLRPIMLFAEEAHLYLRETFWDDIVTRMRHLGVFTTFITNQPDTLRENVWRQVDNIFLFNLANESDIEAISRMSLGDFDTIKSIARTLPRGCCMTMGRVFSELPVVSKIVDPDLLTLGESKSFLPKTGLTSQRDVILQNTLNT